jgi:hypothetical protein
MDVDLGGRLGREARALLDQSQGVIGFRVTGTKLCRCNLKTRAQLF